MITQIKNKITQIKTSQVIIILLIIGVFLFSSSHLAGAFELDEEPRLKTPKINPYSYLPMSEQRPPTKVDRLKRPIISVAPETPTIVTDADGNKLVYQKGKLRLMVDPEGNKKYYMGNLARLDRDFDGNLTKTYKYHSPKASVENEFGEVIGYQEFGKGGLLLKEYDEKGHFIRSYEYTGRKINIVIDLLTNSQTIYNEKGKPDREVNFEGAIIARYYYGDNGKLLYKIDLYGNKTLFHDDGRRERITYDVNGNVISTYEWTANDSYKVTDQYGNTTYVFRGRPQYETNYTGYVAKIYTWEGTKLISSTDLSTNEITYYENGRKTETRYNDYLVGLWKYDDLTGILVSVTDKDGKTTYFDHGREAFVIIDSNFTTESFTWDYKPPLFDEIVEIIRKYKDTSQSIMPEVENLLVEQSKTSSY